MKKRYVVTFGLKKLEETPIEQTDCVFAKTEQEAAGIVFMRFKHYFISFESIKKDLTDYKAAEKRSKDKIKKEKAAYKALLKKEKRKAPEQKRDNSKGTINSDEYAIIGAVEYIKGLAYNAKKNTEIWDYEIFKARLEQDGIIPSKSRFDLFIEFYMEYPSPK